MAVKGLGEQGSDELIARSLPRVLTIPFIMGVAAQKD